ncbi:MAG: DUF11 domain-containing protein [Acidovorax sp.]|uniref:IPTL-CTERM sorting domain-containing protein n=1 Tax=Acidovorax sp. TaxID=1872122 RepID=UPI0025BE7459|nr:IPTL-CTERM sorting domain-containing protein [Acidovorax sp.]MCE1190578.1 DUF11 domain-containing protein [Acidovorax sp.]
MPTLFRPFAASVIALICSHSIAQEVPEIPTVSCTTNPSSFNTGVNADGSMIAAGSPDLQWWVTSVMQNNATNIPPPGGAVWTPAYVPTAPPPYAHPSQADWVSPLPGGYTYPRNSPYPWPYPTPVTTYYRTQFNLAPEVPPSAVQFTMNYVVDDVAHGAFVNGTPTASIASPLVLSGPWQSGLNTIVFPVDDLGWNTGLVLDSQPPAAFTICSVSPIRVQKAVSQPSFTPGATATYSVQVTSLGLQQATGVQLADPVPSGLKNPVWGCSASGGAVCPTVTSGPPFTFDLPGQGSLTFTLSGTVATTGSLSNTATLNPGTGGVCAADTPTPCSATAAAAIGAVPRVVPTLSEWALLGLFGALALFGARKVARRPSR